MSDIFKKIASSAKKERAENFSLQTFLNTAKDDKSLYASAAERLLKAIGEPTIINTVEDSRLNTIFEGRKIKIYPAFKEMYGIEDDIENIRAFLKHAAQGLEERKQILFLLGDVGCGKSTIADILKSLMEQEPIYVLTDHLGNISPVLDNPLGLFIKYKQDMLNDYGISDRYFPRVLSPWALKRLREYEGDISKFSVTKVFPSQAHQVAIAKTEPLDDNNADIGVLIGKVNMKQLQYFNQNDPDAYNFSGALNRANRGLIEMAEMYKANIKTLNPLLEASQSFCYNGLEQIGAIPFDGIILSHSNNSEWDKFASDAKNEAMIDRIYKINMHYCVRYTEEELILRKMINNSELKDAPIVPATFKILAQMAVLSRLEPLGRDPIYSKLRVYNGDDVKNEDNKAKPYSTYKDAASQNEGLSGISTRSEFKMLSRVYNYHIEEISADPVTLFLVLEAQIKADQLDPELEAKYLGYLEEYLKPKFLEELEIEIQHAYMEDNTFAQTTFDRYFHLAKSYLDDKDFPDPNTGLLMDKEEVNKELKVLEDLAGIGDPSDFRNEIVRYILEKKSEGVTVKWNSYKKLSKVIEKSVFKKISDILPIISFGNKQAAKDKSLHDQFLKNMIKKGYTERQVKTLVSYYVSKKHS